MDQLAAMTTFVRVVEAGSLSGAARAMRLSLTSVSRQIAALEAHYGAELLRRTTRRLALTDAGRLVHDRATRVIAELKEIEAALAPGQREVAGRLRVAAPQLMGRLLITPLLPEFLQRYPALSLDLLLADRAVDMIGDEVDVALRIGRLHDSTAIIRKLGEISMIVCAAPDYLARRGTPLAPVDLTTHDCLVFSDLPGAATWRFRSAGDREAAIEIKSRLRINSLDALVTAARDGTGLVRVPSWQVDDELASGRLQRVLQEFELAPSAVQLVFPPRQQSAPSTRAFVDFVTERWRAATTSSPSG